MLIKCDLVKLQKIFKDFYNTSGLAMGFRDANFVLYTSDEMQACNAEFCNNIRVNKCMEKCCDISDQYMIEKCKKTKSKAVYVCHAGLVDIVVPIFCGDIFLGNLTTGQMRKDNDFSAVYERIAKYPLDFEKMEQCFYKLPIYDEEKIESIPSIAVILGKYIVSENIIKPIYDVHAENVITFIDHNLEKNLSLEYIAKEVHISQSSLYRMFESNFQCTVNEYIMRKKIMKSIDMLYNFDLSIEQIAQTLGFANMATYIRVFKKINGVTPLQFRKQFKKYTSQI